MTKKTYDMINEQLTENKSPWSIKVSTSSLFSDIFTLEKIHNELFEIILTSIPSAGYAWSLHEGSRGIELIDKKYTPIENSIGNTVKNVFMLKGTERGEHKLRFVLCRTWEKTQIDEVEYKIIIQ
jgi:predicted secreted protein